MERNIYFKCYCGKHMAVDEAGVGKTVKCSDCGQPIQIPPPEMEWDCSCGAPIILPASMVGETVQCVVCKATYKVPEPEQPDATPKQEPLPVVETRMPISVPPQPNKAKVHILRPNDKPKIPGFFQQQSSPKVVVQSRKCPSCGYRRLMPLCQNHSHSSLL